MRKNIKQLRLEFLEDTIKYYSEDTNRRCYKEWEGCYYSPTYAGKEGISEGCAIGRHLPDSVKIMFDKTGIGNITTKFKIKSLFPLIPYKLKRLGAKFLLEVQNLHDNHSYWLNSELSYHGKKNVNWIKDKWKL